MQLIQLERKIAAPVERCFLLSLSMDLHVQSTAQTGETAIAGVMHGLIGPGGERYLAWTALWIDADANHHYLGLRPPNLL